MRRGQGLLCLAALLFVASCSDDSPSVGTPVDWQIVLDDAGPGVHTVHMIVDFGPTPESAERASSKPPDVSSGSKVR